MRFFKFIPIAFGLFVGLIFFAIYIGIPTIQDRYLEQETQKPKFTAFIDSLSKCDIRLFPEVLDRLLIEAKFDHVSDGQEIVRDLQIRVFADKVEQKIIFDIHLTNVLEQSMSFEEARINNFNELPVNSKYRDFSFAIRPQYKLDNKKDLQL